VLLIICIVCGSGLFLVWFLMSRFGQRRIEIHVPDQLSNARDRVRRLDNQIRRLGSQLNSPLHIRQIIDDSVRKPWESEAQYLDRRLTQLSSVVADLKTQANRKLAARQQ
jgi:hypothetical protein